MAWQRSIKVETYNFPAMTPTVAVPQDIAGAVNQRLLALDASVTVLPMDNDGTLLESSDHVDAVVTGPRGERLRRFLRQHPTARWLAVMSAGVDGAIVPEVLERSIVVTRIRHQHDVPVSEFAMTLMLTAAKSLPTVVLAQQRHEWIDYQPVFLAHRTLVIVGYGEIGLALAHRAKAFEMRVIGVRAHPQPDAVADEVWGTERLEEALAAADYAVLIVPATPTTRGLMGERQLRALPKHAYLINVGRGEVVDEDALDRMLRRGDFAGALLDTFVDEPLPADSPLWSNPRVLVTPHAAGLRVASRTEPVIDQVVANIARFARGEPLVNQIDPSRGY